MKQLGVSSDTLIQEAGYDPDVERKGSAQVSESLGEVACQFECRDRDLMSRKKKFREKVLLPCMKSEAAFVLDLVGRAHCVSMIISPGKMGIIPWLIALLIGSTKLIPSALIAVMPWNSVMGAGKSDHP